MAADGKRTGLIVATGCVVVAALSFAVWGMLPAGDQPRLETSQRSVTPPVGADPRSDEELVEAALSSEVPVAGEAAVAHLAKRTTIEASNPTREHLRHVFQESDQPNVRAASIKGIARGWDYDAMEALFDALDDESLEVRTQAGAAIEKLIGLRFHYRASDPPVKRSETVAKMRSTWVQFRKSPKFDQWLARLANDESLEHLRNGTPASH